MSGVILSPTNEMSDNIQLKRSEISESFEELWEDLIESVSSGKEMSGPSGGENCHESVVDVEGDWLVDHENESQSHNFSLRTQAIIEGLVIDMSNQSAVNSSGSNTPTKGKGDHYHRNKTRLYRKSIDETLPDSKSRLNRKSIDETLPDKSPKKSFDETQLDSTRVGSPSGAISPSLSPVTTTIASGRKSSFKGKRRKQSHKLNFANVVVDMSDDSEPGTPTASPFVKVGMEVVTPPASKLTIDSSIAFNGDSSAKQNMKTPTASSAASPFMFPVNRMQHSPYYRALFGNMAIMMDESSASEVPSPPNEDGGESSDYKLSSNNSPTPLDDHSIKTELFSENEEDNKNKPNVSIIQLPEGIKRSVSYENSWPSLPKPTRIPKSPLSPARREHSNNGLGTPKTSPGSAGRRKSGKKSLSSDSLRFLRSDKYLSLLLDSGSKTPKERRTVSSTALTDSPRRMRFPEPDSVLKSPGASLVIQFPMVDLSDTVAVATPVRVLPFAQQLSPDRHTKVYPIIADSPIPSVSPNGKSSPELTLQLPSKMLSLSSDANDDPFAASLNSGGVSSSSSGGFTAPTSSLAHHHISYARYLAMTATPKSMSRSSTGEELANAAEEASNELTESCYTELDPQEVVRCLFDGISEDRNRSRSLGGLTMTHSLKSLTNNLNLASLHNGIAMYPQPRKKSWDDPDTESDEETEDDATPMGSLLTSIPAEDFQEHIRSFGIVCNVPLFTATLKRCSYYKTLPYEKIQSVDFSWMFQQIYPTYYVLQKGRELQLDHLTVTKVLNSYVSRSLIFHLVGALSHEDDRVTSSRLSLLKMLYLRANCNFSHEVGSPLDDMKKQTPLSSSGPTGSSVGPSIRKSIVVAMEYSSFSRLERCIDSSIISTTCEIDTNYIAKRGYAADGVFTSEVGNATQRDSALRIGCAINGTTKDSEERPAYKTRDNDNNMLELLKFVIAAELSEIQNNLMNEDKGDFIISTSIDLLMNVIRVFFNILRCYGYKLGNSSEHLEMPDTLNSLLECLDGILLWAHLVSVYLHWQYKRNKQIDDATFCEPFYNTVCLLLLSKVSKHWTRHCNFAQDIAFIRVTELLLSVYTPFLSIPEAPPQISPTEISLQIPNYASEGIPGKCLRKLLCALTSPHFKVSLQAIQSLQGMAVLSKYILPSTKPDQLVLVMEDNLNHDDFSEINRKKVNNIKENSNSNQSSMRNVGLTVDDREAGLIILVDRLRQNRVHWHPIVQQSSTMLMNLVYDRLQDLEDAQEDFNDIEEHNNNSGDSYDPEEGNFL